MIPTAQPEPPPKQPDIRILRLFAIVGGFGCLLAALMGIIMGYGVWIASLKPKGLPRIGRPTVVKSFDDGWATYALQDLGIQIDLPGMPQTVPIDTSKWSRISQIQTSAYAYYEGSGPNFGYTLHGYVYRSRSPESPDDYIRRGDEAAIKKVQMDKGSRKVTRKMVDGWPVSIESYRYKDHETSATFFGLFIFGPKSVRDVTCFYWSATDADAQADWTRMVDSMKFLPNVAGTNYATGPGASASGD